MSVGFLILFLSVIHEKLVQIVNIKRYVIINSRYVLTMHVLGNYGAWYHLLTT